MSSGKPEDFCWNDLDKMTFDWNMLGDADPTNMTNQTTFDAVSFHLPFCYNTLVAMFQLTVELYSCFSALLSLNFGVLTTAQALLKLAFNTCGVVMNTTSIFNINI
jgi:hypothetical protein